MKNAQTGILNLSFNNRPRSFIFLIFLLIIFSTSSLMAQVKLSSMPTPNGDVYAIKRVGNVVFIGGDFDSIGGFERRHLCAIDAITGSVLSWNPSPNRVIRNVLFSTNKIIVSGDFDSIAGVPANIVAVFEFTTLNLLPLNYTSEWIRSYTIVTDSNYLYYLAQDAVNFYTYISRIDLNTIQLDTNWRCSLLNNQPPSKFGLSFYGNYLYFVDKYFQYSFGNSTINQVCRFNITTLQIDTLWNPISISSPGKPDRIEVYNGKIYIGGNFNEINGLSRKGIVEMDTSGIITNKSFNLSNSMCTAWLFQGNNIWIGSNSFVIGGMNRPRLAQVNLASGLATCWDAFNTGISGALWITALDVHQDTVYTGCTLNSPNYNYFETLVGNPSFLNIGPDLNICPPASFTLNAQNAGFQSYLWSNGGTTASITSAVPGLYWVTASNTSLGCSATDSVYVDFCTSLEDPDEKDLLKVVQPVGDYLQFKIDSRIGDDEFKIEVIDLAGKTVLSSFGASGEISISVSGLKPSIYLLRIRTVANKQLFAKFLKE